MSFLVDALAHFLMWGVWVLITAGCGVMLFTQQAELREKAVAAVAKCNGEAELLVARNDRPTLVASASDFAVRANGLEATLADSGRAREAYAECMDAHSLTRPEGITAPKRD